MSTGLLAGKVAVVLGASAEGGIGWTTAEVMAREGAKVVVAARNVAQLEKLAKRLDGMAVQCDATKRADVAALADRVAQRFGKVDCAVYSAGGVSFSTIEDTNEKALQEALDVNFLGAFYFVQEMSRVIGRNGAVTLISSIGATNVQDGVVAYSCAKGATGILVRYAAREFGERQIRVNCVSPGVTDTPMVAGATRNPQVRQAFEREIPLGRIGQPGDVAECIAFLSSDRAGYITGAFVPIDGGNFMTRLPRYDELPSMEQHQQAFDQASKESGRD